MPPSAAHPSAPPVLTALRATTSCCPGATAKERSLLLLKLHMWDVHGLNRIAPLDLLAALELRHPSIRRPKSAAGGGPTPLRPGSGSSSPGAPGSRSSPGGPAMPTRALREAWASDSGAATSPPPVHHTGPHDGCTGM
jgi:hypothetical protein